MADDKRPEGLETKDTRGTLLSYTPAEVPHVSRTGGELSDAERENADRAIGSPHSGSFDDSVAADSLGQKSDSPDARRVGEGHYPAEGPAAPGAAKPKNDQPDSAVPNKRTPAK